MIGERGEEGNTIAKGAGTVYRGRDILDSRALQIGFVATALTIFTIAELWAHAAL